VNGMFELFDDKSCFTFNTYNMKKTYIAGAMIAIVLLYLPFSSKAWGVLGHRIVGQIADSHLSPKAKKAITGILGNESIAMSSNWADFIKSDSAFNYLGPWHYINIKGGLDEEQAIRAIEADTSVTVFNRINFLKAELKKKTLPLVTKQMYLRLLIHLVGDIHQPLHVGRPDDRGGNRIRVLWFKDSYNLHQIWDEVLVDFQQLSYTEYAAAINFSKLSQRIEWNKSSLSYWMYESYLIAEQIYGDIKTNEDKLGYQYNFKYKAVVDDRLLKGGVRLAYMLNEIFG
jgi:hypothetical protein